MLDRPQPGFFRVRLVRRGPWVSAAIRRICSCTINGGSDNARHEWRPDCDRFPPLSCEVDGQERNDRLMSVWVFGRPISEKEFRYMRDAAAWDRTYAPDAPTANPLLPVDFNAIKPKF